MNRYWSFLGLLAILVCAPGCGPDINGLCEAQENCLGGNDADIDACVAANDGARDNAHDIGCGEEYDLLVECLSSKYKCTAVGTCAMSSECNRSACVKGECKRYELDAADVTSCEAELNAYSRCD